MIQLNKVFNYSISAKPNKEYKTIYILCNKNTITLKKLTTSFNKSSILTTPDVISVLNKILTKQIPETMMNIDNKFNVIISLTNSIINYSPKYLLTSMQTNNIRNINLLLPGETNDTYYKLTEGLLIELYSINKNQNIKISNYFINYLNSELSKQYIQNIIFLTKSVFICKHTKITKLEQLALEPNIKLETNKSDITYLHYKPIIKKQNINNKIIILIGPLNLVYSVITMCSLLKKKNIIKAYLSSKPPSTIPKLSNVIYFKKSSKNIIEYSQDTSKEMIQRLLNEAINLSVNIKFKLINDKKLVKMKLTDECLAVRLLSVV
jgi:hypothetical protein